MPIKLERSKLGIHSLHVSIVVIVCADITVCNRTVYLIIISEVVFNIFRKALPQSFVAVDVWTICYVVFGCFVMKNSDWLCSFGYGDVAFGQI